MGRKSWTDHQLEEAVANNISLRGILRDLGLNYTGGNQSHIKKAIIARGFDTSHFLGQAHMRGKEGIKNYNLPLEELLVQNSDYNRSSLKRRLINAGLLDPTKCAICGISARWKDKSLVLEMDHINGVYNDNRLENLRLICPNCHSQLPTTHGGNRKKPPRLCPDCEKEISKGAKYCLNCASRHRRQLTNSPTESTESTKKSHQQLTKIDWPSTPELEKMLEESNYTQVGKKLGVSDNAVRKRLRNHPA